MGVREPTPQGMREDCIILFVDPETDEDVLLPACRVDNHVTQCRARPSKRTPGDAPEQIHTRGAECRRCGKEDRGWGLPTGETQRPNGRKTQERAGSKPGVTPSPPKPDR